METWWGEFSIFLGVGIINLIFGIATVGVFEWVQQNEIGILKKKDTKFIKYSKKIIKPTSEEIQSHKNFLKNELKKNFFN